MSKIIVVFTALFLIVVVGYKIYDLKSEKQIHQKVIQRFINNIDISIKNSFDPNEIIILENVRKDLQKIK